MMMMIKLIRMNDDENDDNHDIDVDDKVDDDDKVDRHYADNYGRIKTHTKSYQPNNSIGAIEREIEIS